VREQRGGGERRRARRTGCKCRAFEIMNHVSVVIFDVDAPLVLRVALQRRCCVSLIDRLNSNTTIHPQNSAKGLCIDTVVASLVRGHAIRELNSSLLVTLKSV
jgi:hypothetical protein